MQHQPRAVERPAPVAPPVMQRAPVQPPQAMQRAPTPAPQQAAPAQSSRRGHQGDNGGIAERLGVQRPNAQR
jgi:hypothetical protein